MRHRLACLAVPLALFFFGAAGGFSHAQDEAPEVSDLRAVLDADDGTRVEPKGLMLRTRDVMLAQKPPSFEERTGISPYLLWALAGIATLAAALAALGYWRMIRGPITTGGRGYDRGGRHRPPPGGRGDGWHGFRSR